MLFLQTSSVRRFLLCGWSRERHLVLFCFLCSFSVSVSRRNQFNRRHRICSWEGCKNPQHRIGRKGAGMEDIKGRAMCCNMKAADVLHEKINKSSLWPTLNNSVGATCVNSATEIFTGSNSAENKVHSCATGRVKSRRSLMD